MFDSVIGLDEDEIREIKDTLQEILRLEEPIALKKLDKFLAKFLYSYIEIMNEMAQADTETDSDVNSELIEFKDALKQLKNHFDASQEVEPFYLDNFRESLEALGKYWSPSQNEQYRTELERVKKQANEFLDSLKKQQINNAKEKLRTEKEYYTGMLKSRVPLENDYSFQRTIEFLEYEIESLKSQISREDFSYFENELRQIKELHHKVKIMSLEVQIENLLEREVHSIASVHSILKATKEVELQLKKNKALTPDRKAQIKLVKERSAIHRARKKVEEAEVATAGGYEKKKKKLMAQAKVILFQDWKRIFPNSNPPKEVFNELGLL